MSAPHPAAFIPADPDVDHIESPANTDADLVWFMLCGASCLVGDDGAVFPAIDFYAYSWGHKATCAGCLAVWRSA